MLLSGQCKCQNEHCGKQREGILHTKLPRFVKVHYCTPHNSTLHWASFYSSGDIQPGWICFNQGCHQKLSIDSESRSEKWDSVLVQDYRSLKRSWIPGTIGGAHYKVKVLNRTWKQHVSLLSHSKIRVTYTKEPETLFLPNEEPHEEPGPDPMVSSTDASTTPSVGWRYTLTSVTLGYLAGWCPVMHRLVCRKCVRKVNSSSMTRKRRCNLELDAWLGCNVRVKI